MPTTQRPWRSSATGAPSTSRAPSTKAKDAPWPVVQLSCFLLFLPNALAALSLPSTHSPTQILLRLSSPSTRTCHTRRLANRASLLHRSSSADFFLEKKLEESSCLPFESRKVEEKKPLRVRKVVTLDFEARVPVPFSVFPSTYKETDNKATKTTKTHEEVSVNLPQKAGREGQYSSYQATASRPSRVTEEEVRITREEERYRRPGVHSEYYREEHRSVPPSPSHCISWEGRKAAATFAARNRQV